MNIFTINNKVNKSFYHKSQSITRRTFTSYNKSHNSSVLLSLPLRRQANKINRYVIRSFHSSKPLLSPNKMGHARKILNMINKKDIPKVSPQVSDSNNVRSIMPEKIINNLNSSNSNIFNKVISLIPTPKATQSNFNKIEMPHILHNEMPHVLQNKEALVRFCNMFKGIKEEDKEQISYIISYLQSQLSQNPLDFNRALQTCIETTLKKIPFSELELQSKFPSMHLLDITEKNNGITDSSTLFSLLQTEWLIKSPGYKNNIEASVVISTGINSDNLKNLPLKIQDRFVLSKKNTGNILNDIDLDGIHYDYKITRNIEYAKNHIIFFSFDDIQMYKQYLYQLQSNYNEKLKNPGNMSKIEYEYIQKLTGKLRIIWEDPSLNMVEKTIKWNEVVFIMLAGRSDTTINIPILIPTSYKPYEIEKAKIEALQDIALPNSRKLEPQVVLNTVKDIIDRHDKVIQNNAYQMTKGVIGKSNVCSNVEDNKDS